MQQNRHNSNPIRPAPSPFARLLRKLLGGFIAIGFFMLIIYGLMSWEQENKEMQNSLAIQAAFAAKSSQALFDNIGTSMELLGLLLGEQNVLQHPEAARPALLEFQSNHPEIAAMALIRPDGTMLLNTAAQPGEPLPDLSKDPAMFRALRFDMYTTYSYNIGPNQAGMGLKRWYFPFRHTVLDKAGSPLFVIQGAIPIESAGLLWSDLPLIPGSRVGLIRDDGYVQLLWPIVSSGQVYRTQQSGAMMQAIRSSPGMIAGRYDGKSNLDGTARIGAYTHLPNANMASFVSVPKREMLALWWKHNYLVLISFIGYLAVIGFIAYRLTAREREHTQELLAQSRKDPLTGLPNRIALDELINQEIARSSRSGGHAALLYLDLDNFKDINDTLGHANGDRLLERVALRMRGILRQEDTLARLGGDEFLVLLPDSNAERAGLVAQRIIELFVTPFQVAKREILVSTSVGICMFPDNGRDSSTLLLNADTAMYEAKRQRGNNFAFYVEELGERVRQRLQLQHDLQRALDRQELALFFQPLVDLKSGQIVGAEALVRWMDPQHGLRNPAEFIPFAEESGLILPLGEWVLRTACQQGKRWADQGFDIQIAVNLSTRQFQDPDLLAKIGKALVETGFAPSRLELEITESASMLDPEASIHVMGKLKALGIQIAIDDFGTGYSSLSYLKRIPADIIKIDRSFVNGLDNDPDDFAIVKTVLALGQALEKRCLAEGIETAEHFELLRNLGCYYGQGYWMSKPLPVEDFENLMLGEKCYA